MISRVPEQKESKLLEIALLKECVKQFAHPPRCKLASLASWTLRPPKASASEKPRNIGVLLQGQF